MRQFCAITLSCLLLAGILLGCSSKPANEPGDKPVAVDPKIKVDNPVGGNNGAKEKDKKQDAPKNGIEFDPVALEKEQKFKDALHAALKATLDNDHQEALEHFEAALALKDDDFVRAEIARLKGRIEQDGTVKSTIKNIETVINEGKADEAAKLVNDALKEFGAGNDADTLVQLKLQTDALQAVQNKEEPAARFKRFQQEGNDALAEKNLRAAVLAYEQALQAQDDKATQQKYEDARAALEKYDTLRKRAAELRRDPLQLEAALDALKQAQEAWDTLPVRNEIDEVTLALAQRRDTISVADFEVRDNVGVANAGAAIADEILPRLKAKYDIVDRTQLQRALADLKLDLAVADNGQQEQLGQVAKIRYLVVGSIHPIAGVTIHARLIDVRTGLVVQTAKLVAPTIEEAMNQAPDLAKQLLMTDEEKMQFDFDMQQKAAQKIDVVEKGEEIKPAPLPPEPEMAPAPPKLRILNPAPPLFGDVEPDAFAKLPPAPEKVLAPAVELPPPAMRHRVLMASIEMGDELFRLRRFREAHKHFEFALLLAPDHFDIRLRLERVRPFLPAPPVVVVAQPVFARPRLAVLPFVTKGRPGMVPPSLSYWTPSHLAPYFASRYEVVDTAEIYWFMGRMGLTIRDLMVDPDARRWLGRAVGVRYFVLGSHVETFSFDVNAYLVDAEFGHLVGSGRIHVHHRHELKMRLPELAAITMMTPAERLVYFEAQRQARFEALVVSGRRAIGERRFAQAVLDLEAALTLRPGVIFVQHDLIHAREALRLEQIQAERRRQWELQQAQLAAHRANQLKLAQEAEAARRRAIADAAARDAAAQKVHLNLRFQAQNQMITQAQIALKTKNFGISVNLFQGAIGLAPPPALAPMPPPPIVFQDFAHARLEAERAAALREAQLAAARETFLKQKRQKELLAAQLALAAEQKRQREAEEAARLTLLKRDQAAYDAGIQQGTNLLGQKKYEAAIVALQGAQRVAHGLKQRSEVDQLLQLATQRQAEALAKSEAERQELERKLAVERERRKAAELLAKQNEQKYQDALQLAQKALSDKNYDLAQTKFEEAGTVRRTDTVLAGLKQVSSARAAQLAEQKKAAAEAKRAEQIKQLINDGNLALTNKDYEKAASLFAEARKLAPTDLAVMTGLTRAEQLRKQRDAEQRRLAEQSAREQNFQRLLKTGQENLKNKQYEAAVAALSEAVNLNPGDAGARAALKQAEQGRDAAFADVKEKAAAKARLEAYQKHLTAGQAALSSKRYDDAIKAFGDAQKLLPGDKASKDYLQEAQNAKKAAEDAIVLAAKMRAEEKRKAMELQTALTQGRSALAANDLALAEKLFLQAKAINPKDQDVLRSLKDLEQAVQRKTAEEAALKKRDAEFKSLLDVGKAALAKKDYAAALKAFSSATTLNPQDKTAQSLFRQAQTEQRQAEEAAAQAKLQATIDLGLAALKKRDYDAAEKALRSAILADPKNPTILQGLKDIEIGRKTLAEEKQKLAGYQLAVGAGEKAMKAKDYDSAVKSFQQALQWLPNDPQAMKLLVQAQQAQIGANQALANFKAAMDAGEKAMKAQQYAVAVKAFTEATKLMPGDLRARQLLGQAQQALQQQQMDEVERKAFASLIKQADAAVAGKNFEAAVKLYSSALKIMPKDAQALQGLQSAQKALDASKMKTPPQPNPFDQAMQRAQGLEKERKYTEAMKAYQDALKIRPKDADALAGMKRSQFNHHLVLGQQYLQNGMFVEAQREAETALRIQPGDKEAQSLLDKAKKKSKK